MATSLNSSLNQSEQSSEALLKLEEQLTCSVCLERYKNPKILPCFHSFCLDCLKLVKPAVTEQDTAYSLPCPTCRTPFRPPDEQGIDSMPSSFTINNLTEVYTLMKISTGSHFQCDGCQNNASEEYCKHCAKLLCQQCLQDHDLEMNDHEVLGFDQLVNTTVTASFDHIPIVGQESIVNLSLSHGDGSPALVPSSLVSCLMTSPASPQSDVECTIKEVSKSHQYGVVFIPRTSGAHQLFIKVCGHIISGNPVSIPVSVPVTMRGDVVKTITGFKKPYGVAVSNDGKVVVSEWEGQCITIVTRDGERLRSFGSRGKGKGQFNRPTGIAVTPKGTLLVVDNGNHNIQEFTLYGECVSCVGRKGNGRLQFDGPRGIAINKTTGQVYVVDTVNHRVQVLNADLTFSRMFGGKGSGKGQLSRPYGIAIDSHGHVYVAERDNNRIQKFTPEGQFVSFIGNSKGSKPGQLSEPTFLAFDDNDLLYVSEWHPNHRISVFSTTGKHVHCFGESSLNWPNSVVMDSTTASLFVCDDKNVHVF